MTGQPPARWRPERPELLLRMADAGATYMTWTWSDAASRTRYCRLSDTSVAEAVELTARAVPSELTDARSAVSTGMLATPDREESFGRTLAELVLPDPVCVELSTRFPRGAERPRVRIAPSPRLARTPWELLPVARDGTRLIEIADVVYDVPTTVLHGRLPPVHDAARGATVFVIDPVEAGAAALVPRQSRAPLVTALGAQVAAVQVTRDDLGRALRTGAQRLFYYGHASGDPQRPGSAALHLSDDSRTTSGWSRSQTRRHAPLTAIDLYRGTVGLPDVAPDDQRFGQDLWPMPPRVALVACRSGTEHAATEPFGLVVAAMLNGADLVTSTRWPLPADMAFRGLAHPIDGLLPTSAMAVAVNAAHAAADPAAQLSDWQRRCLADWRATGSAAASPVLWAAVTTHLAPR